MLHPLTHIRPGVYRAGVFLVPEDGFDQVSGLRFPRAEIIDAVSRFRRKLAKTPIPGESEPPRRQDNHLIDLVHVSHHVLDCYIEDDILRVEIQLRKTPPGRVITMMLRRECRMFLRSRMTIKKYDVGRKIVLECDFITFDVTSLGTS